MEDVRVSEQDDLLVRLGEIAEILREHLGEGEGEEIHQLIRDLIDIIRQESVEMVEKVIKRRVASWALTDSDETIPLEKFSREAILNLMRNRQFVSDSELAEILAARLAA